MSWSGLSDSQDGARAKKQRLYSPDDDRDNDSFTTSFRLNWGWVATLNQDPEGKDYFPPCFNPLGMGYHFLGDEIEKPTVLGTGELPRYTAWALAAFRRGTRSATMAKMMDDQNVRALYPFECEWPTYGVDSFVRNGSFAQARTSTASSEILTSRQ